MKYRLEGITSVTNHGRLRWRSILRAINLLGREEYSSRGHKPLWIRCDELDWERHLGTVLRRRRNRLGAR